jgi:hypothetical protein
MVLQGLACHLDTMPGWKTFVNLCCGTLNIKLCPGDTTYVELPLSPVTEEFLCQY